MPHVIVKLWPGKSEQQKIRFGVERDDQPRQGLRPDAALDEVAEGYRAMDERRAIKALLRP